MRHLFVAAAMLFTALAITFGTANILQAMAVAHNNNSAGTAVVEAAKPALAAVGKQRLASPRDGVISARMIGL